MLQNATTLLSIAELPMAEAGQLLLVSAAAFAIITLIASTYRFHRMIEFSEDELDTVEDCNNFFFVQVTRYLSKINRVSNGFGLFIVRFTTDAPDRRAVQEAVLRRLNSVIRNAEDKACLFQEDCAGAVIDTPADRVQQVARRLARDLQTQFQDEPRVVSWRAGAAAFPMHGLTTRDMIDSALDAIDNGLPENDLPLRMAPDPENNDDTVPQEIGELSKEDKSSSLDPLTGVLKSKSVPSYMRKYLFEIRRKKEPAAVLCIGISRIDRIIELHDESAGDVVIAGVADLLKNLTRDCDLIGRLTRDAFLILAPCSLEQGELISRRLRNAVQQAVFMHNGRRIKTAVRIGITAHPEHGRNLRDLFGGAHRALAVLRGWDTDACLIYDPRQHGNLNDPVPGQTS